LQEIDGMTPQLRVLVIGATNRPRALDPALLRGGRLSQVIDIPLPDVEQRLKILELLTARMPLEDVDLEDLALESSGFSGPDLKGLCQQAALESMIRLGADHQRRPAVTSADFVTALAAHASGRAASARRTRSRRT